MAYHLIGDAGKAIEIQRKAISLIPEGASCSREPFEEQLVEFEAALNGEK
jgi:hypothetical protein